MIALLAIAQVTMQTLAPGIAQAVPPTAFSCNMMAADGSHFTLSGTSPEFPKGWDPNSSKSVELQSSHAAFRGQVGMDPGDAGEWFREFQVSNVTGDTRHTLHLMLRRNGTSVAYATRYQSTGERIPYDYHSAGICKADFAPAAGKLERGR